jgi:hypothetical protein
MTAVNFFADIFSKYWFVFCLAVLVAGTASTSSVSGRRVVVAKVVAVFATGMIILGLLGLLLQ